MPAFAGLQTLVYGALCLYAGAHLRSLAPHRGADELTLSSSPSPSFRRQGSASALRRLLCSLNSPL